MLGTHEPAWLPRTDVPLFVSHRRLARRKSMPGRALGSWALDSGGFSELSIYGAWQTAPRPYVDAVQRYAGEIGRLDWAAPQDWMCEPMILARTGLDVAAHQRRTVDNFVELRSSAAGRFFIPVLQGWTLADYLWCLDLYALAGVDLLAEPLVGLGSVCRRQATGEIAAIVEHLAGLGLRLHGFGVKLKGLTAFADLLESGDSMAWSYDARRADPLAGCTHKTCTNCMVFAQRWRGRVVQELERSRQMRLRYGG